jgi:Rrf2 family cysteine metabolism transcriptional repressor
MLVSQKGQYALRAVYHLAKCYGQGPVKIADIARTQDIPCRFLEVILSQLKQGGFVASQRGNAGGYYLVREPHDLSVGEIVCFIEGPSAPVDCLAPNCQTSCALKGDCVFLSLWEQLEDAIAHVYDTNTFQDLLNREADIIARKAPSYVI